MLNIRGIYSHRQLIWTLAWGEFKGRYKNSIMGYFWSLLEPLFMLLVLYIVFSNLMKSQVEYYPMFLLLGIIMWNFFSRATTMGLNAIIGKPSFIKKIYFPREILVISTCITALLLSIFESLVFILFMVYFQIPLSINLIFIPLIIIIFFVLTLGVALVLASLNVYYRDVQFIWQVVLQAGFFLTPIIYPVTIFPDAIQRIILLNPVGQLIIAARDTIIYSTTFSLIPMVYTAIVALALLAIGIVIFSHYEPSFAEKM
jgi:lipopolysaccharide transport system permease protein